MEAIAATAGRMAIGRARPARTAEAVRGDTRKARGLPQALLLAAAALVGWAVFLPLWGMTLVSVQYPEGLRMVVYPLRMRGDLTEINVLNSYIGMARISPEFFGELRVIAALLAGVALLCVVAAVVRRRWVTLLPLVLMALTGAYGLWRMRVRLYEYGHQLDPLAPIDITPFTPAMAGANRIAQFATYAWFSWGTMLPVIAGVLVVLAFWLEGRPTGARN